MSERYECDEDDFNKFAQTKIWRDIVRYVTEAKENIQRAFNDPATTSTVHCMGISQGRIWALDDILELPERIIVNIHEQPKETQDNA